MEQAIKNVQTWLQDNYSEETKKTIRNWARLKDFEHINDAFYKDLEWGIGGIRAKVGIGTNRINHYTITRIAQAYSNYLNKKHLYHKSLSVAIAYDSRQKSSYYAQLIAETISANQIHVNLFDIITPLPILAFGVQQLNCAGGLMITAGHLDKGYNGIKFLDEQGYELSEDEGALILEEMGRIQKRADITQSSDLTAIDLVSETIEQAYMKHTAQNSFISNGKKELKIFYSPWNGTGTILAPEVFNRAGFPELAYKEEHLIPAPDFKSLPGPDPTAENALQCLFDAALEENADVIIATSGDCSRIAVAAKTKDGFFKQLTGHQIAALIVEYLLRKSRLSERWGKNNVIAKSILTSSLISEIAKNYGFACENVPVGLNYPAFKTRKYLLGVEESGSLILPEINAGKDGLLYALLIAEAAEEAKLNSQSLWDILYAHYEREGYFYEDMREVTFDSPQAENLIDKIINNLLEDPPKKITDLLSVKEVKNYQDGTVINTITGEVDFISDEQTMLLELDLTDGTKIFIRPSQNKTTIKYYAHFHQLMDKTTDIEKAKETIKSKIDRLFIFFKNY